MKGKWSKHCATESSLIWIALENALQKQFKLVSFGKQLFRIEKNGSQNRKCERVKGVFPCHLTIFSAKFEREPHSARKLKNFDKNIQLGKTEFQFNSKLWNKCFMVYYLKSYAVCSFICRNIILSSLFHRNAAVIHRIVNKKKVEKVGTFHSSNKQSRALEFRLKLSCSL